MERRTIGGAATAPSGVAPPHGGRTRWRRRAPGALVAGMAALCCAWPAAVAAQSPERGYELVSPADKNGGEVYRFSNGAAAPDGGALAFATNSAIPGAPSSPVSNMNVARRTPTGWVSTPVAPPSPEVPRQFWDVGYAFSADLSQLVFGTRMQLMPNAPRDVDNLYLRTADGGLELLTPATPDAAVGEQGAHLPYFVGASEDFSRVVFFVRAGSLTGDTPGADTAGGNLYEWRDGVVRPIAVLPDGTIAQGSAAGADFVDSTSSRPHIVAYGSVVNTVSADGSRVFFHAPVGPAGGITGRLYVKVDGRRTQEVSAPQPGVVDPNGPWPPRFAGAARDGSIAYLISCERLTHDATAHPGTFLRNCAETSTNHNLYRYDVDRDELTNVTPFEDARVQNVMAVSDDGHAVAFIAWGAFAPGAQPGESNLYHWDGTTLRYVATASPFAPNLVRMTPDGRHVVFSTATSVTDYESIDASGTPRTQIYRWTVGDAVPTCLSCPEGPPTGDAGFDSNYGSTNDPSYLPRNVTTDGRRVFFSSPDPLVPGSDNGRRKVYVNDGGVIKLISSGASPGDDYFIDASVDGRDVFFATAEALVPGDRDGAYDIYNARIGGGFPAEPPAERCAPARCREPLPPQLLVPPPGSTTLFGHENGVAGEEVAAIPVFDVRPPTRAQRIRWAKRGRAVLVVRVSQPGRVAVRLRARLGRRGTVVARATRVARRAGDVRLPLTLSAKARARLRRANTLPLVIVVRYGQEQPKRIRVTLRRARANSAAATSSRRNGPTRPKQHHDREEAR